MIDQNITIKVTVLILNCFAQWLRLFQAVDLYNINFEIEAERKAERIDLNGAGAESDQIQSGSFASSSSSFVGQNSNTDPFRSGPIDYTL